MTEWPLIAFTITLELACGSALATTLFDGTVHRSDPASMRLLGISVFPVAAAALLVSLFHLGRPSAAWRAFSNLGSSRLSLEVFLCALFALAALAYSALWWLARSEGRLALGVVTGVIGMAAVISSAIVYPTPAQPVWDSGWVPVSFLGAVLLLGGGAGVLLGASVSEGLLQKIYLAAILFGGFALLASAAWMIVHLSQGSPDEYVSAQLQSGLHLLLAHHGIWFGLHILLAGLLPLGLVIVFWLGGGANLASVTTQRLCFLALLFGTVIGRTLMFALADFRQ
jgi:anaerobic dimethyl sulfoxide reductase subunit C (anchor subunit)